MSSPVARAAERATGPALIFGDRTLSWAELGARIARSPAPDVLTPELHVEDVVGVLAALDRGRSVALLHPRWTDAERSDAEARFRARTPLTEPEVVVFTSGSSGRPKGVRLPHRALFAAARAHAEALPFLEADRWLVTLPLAHVGGLSILTRCLHAARTVVLGPARFEAAAVRGSIDAHAVTLLSLVPTMLERLLDHAEAPPPTLRAVLLGGAACPAKLLARGRAAGWPLLPTYGMSETCGQVCTQRLAAPAIDGVGPPLPGVDVRLEEGVIAVDGPTVMAGYLDAPRTGPFRTGDLGRIDDTGSLHVLGRADARILTGGENVDPIEVERALETHPAVRAALVVGIDDDTWGQRVAALVVAEGAAPTLAELRAHLTDRLAPFKHPRALRVVTSLPRRPDGKPDRSAPPGPWST